MYVRKFIKIKFNYNKLKSNKYSFYINIFHIKISNMLEPTLADVMRHKRYKMRSIYCLKIEVGRVD